MQDVFNKKCAAKKLGISTETLDRYRKKGKLAFHKIGDRIVFTDNDLTAFLNACAVPTTAAPTDREKLEIAKVTTKTVTLTEGVIGGVA